MPLLPSALPPKGEARRYVANDFLNLIALPDGEGKEEAGSFLNHKENRVKPKISTMVFLGERKSILPGAEAAADKDLHSTAIRPREVGQSRKKLIQTDVEVQAMYLLFREYHLLPSAIMKLGYGERQVLYAFIRYEMEEREKNKQATK